MSLAWQQQVSEAARKVLKNVLLGTYRQMATTQVMNGHHLQVSADQTGSERQSKR
jgi:hypothetical protein